MEPKYGLGTPGFNANATRDQVRLGPPEHATPSLLREGPREGRLPRATKSASDARSLTPKLLPVRPHLNTFWPRHLKNNGRLKIRTGNRRFTKHAPVHIRPGKIRT